MSFSERLQTLIDLKKINQVDVAKAVGVSESRVSIWLSGETKKPQRKKLQLLASLFGCDINWLASGTGEPFPQPKFETAEKQNQFTEHKESSDLDKKVAKIERALFKQQCPGYFNDFFDFIADTYGADREGVDTFLEDYRTNPSNSEYRIWLEEKKSENNSGENDTPSSLAASDK